MFRRDLIRDLDRLIHRVRHEDISVMIERLPYDLPSRQLFYECIRLLRYGLCKGLTGSDQNCRRQFVMFCLGQKVGSHISGIRRLIGDHQDLAWSCHRVYAHMPVHRFLCKRDIDISRSYDLIYLRNTLRTIRQRADRLCAAYLIDRRRSGFLRGDQSIRRYLPVSSRRRYHDDLFHPRHLRRNNIHQHRRRICRFSARHIDAYPPKRRHLLSKDRSVRLAVEPAILLLLLMIILYVMERFADNLQ